MAKITRATATANNEVAFIAWALDGMIEGCLGFDIVRIRVDGLEEPRGLATWVPFPGQQNPTWTPQDTGVWPVQKLYWRDLTLRRHRSDAGVRDSGFTVKYSVRAVGALVAGLPPVPVRQPKAYTGPAVPLGYLGDAVETNAVTIDSDCNGIRATFTNGILSGQWLRHAIESAGKSFDVGTIASEIADRTSPIRAYLTGDVLQTVGLFLTDPAYAKGRVRFALYELHDDELIELLIAHKDRIEIILSNTSKARGGTTWDATNADARQRLRQAGVTVHNRMFNNNHIGHNKFAVWLDAKGVPSAVMTGSTNWTATGLCGQTNNAVVITSSDVAAGYDTYWKRLLADTFPEPRPLSAAGTSRQRQGAEIREANMTPVDIALHRSEQVRLWFSPNTDSYIKREDAPPDLGDLFSMMAKAKKAIFFLAFLPSRAGLNSVISAAIAAGAANPDLLVAGAISDVSAMPGYIAPDKSGRTQAARDGVKPYTYDKNHTHIVRAAALGDIVGAFEAEVLKVGNAVVHDKIVVIDPLDDHACLVATGSHNLGYKASYENDENLVFVRGNAALARAYAVHVLDVYDHYRFRAWQAKDIADGAPHFGGAINGDDRWLRDYASGRKGDIGRYFV